MNNMTVKMLINKLKKVKNQDAVVVLCELEREYIGFSRVLDESQKPDKDGVIGVVALTLDCDEKERRKS